MAITAESLTRYALFSVGSTLTGGPTQDDASEHLMAALEAQAPVAYEVARGKTAVPGLVLEYLKRELLVILEGQLASQRDGHLGPLLINYEQVWRRVLEMKKQVQEEIVRLEKRAGAGMRPAVGEIHARAPVDVGTYTVEVETVAGVRVGTSTRRVSRPDPGRPGYGGSPIDRVGQYPPR